MDHRTLDATIQDALRGHAWGASRPFGNVTATVYTYAEAYSDTYTAIVHVRVEPIAVAVHKRTITVPPQPVEVTGKGSVRSRDWYCSADVGQAATAVVAQCVRDMAHLLYEADPRIGSCNNRYPHLPLFDPPNGVEGMRRIPGCPLCGRVEPDPGAVGYRVWGGGNVGWVHPTCLVRVRS